MAGINFVRLVIQYPGNILICGLVAVSMFLTIMLAKTLGAILPITAKTLHLDPALMASPMLTTIVDACSMVIYFTMASKLLKLL